MLDYVWGGMILIGIVVAAFTGNMQNLTTEVLNSARNSITIALAIVGILCMWTGLMKIAEKSGLIDILVEKMEPILRYLFPDLKDNKKANKYIATNMIANLLGLGWAATPAGIRAMQEMQKVNKNKSIASKSMCMFMIINMSSLQIVSVNIIAFRSQYESINPSEIISLGIVATIASTLAGIIFVKVAERWYFR
jgi:spore maturation protein A